MRKRTMAREYALQILYSIDISKTEPAERMEMFWDNTEEDDTEIKKFANMIVRGVMKHHDKIDELISKYATNWDIARMAVIDRNILRLATFELLFADDIPPKVSINEAIDIAKRFGDKDSGSFVNGILDKIHKTESKKAI
jgi:transcription antitermination factor NusB